MNHKTKIFTIVLIFIYLFICAIVISVAQDTTLSVTGFVVDETSGYPVSNHLVVVTVVGGGFNEDYEFYTNDAGYYGSEFIPAPGQGLVSAVTFDCLGVEHYQEEYFSPDNTIFVFDFEICTDTIPQGDCEADFDYMIDTLPSGAYLAQFFDLSIGEPDYWLWDFGDGEYSEEQNPEHIYYYPETYFVCLTIFNDTANCYDMYCKEVVVGNGGPDCENWFWYETNDNITFDFYGESFPLQADEWLWDFGDGNTTEGQDVSHTYNPNQGDLFNVSLITITYDPVFGDSCFAISYQWVMVGNSMNCEANYYFEQDTINEFTVNFFDSSTGIISNRYWDFGDGTFSEEINPVHSYSEPGSFSVCLSIYSDTLGFYCSDTYCTDVEILYSISSDFFSIMQELIPILIARLLKLRIIGILVVRYLLMDSL
ncbi:MAG: hypothetical protein B6D61_03880 [Bacteroidetes bacterium 4484_249]|nr:MAG: hypothetical protein B6D61_03880 [Bacteroidetes bacterium 4484_249]